MTTLKERIEARAKRLLETSEAKTEPVAKPALSLRERLAAAAAKKEEQAKPWPAPTTTSPAPSPAPVTEPLPKAGKRRSLAEIIAERKAALAKAEIEAPIIPLGPGAVQPTPEEIAESAVTVSAIEPVKGLESIPATEEDRKLETFSTDIVLNEKQLMVRDMMLAGKSLVVTGAAGTGKTTVQRAGAEALLQSKALSVTNFKIQGTKEYVSAPSIAFVAYTRRACDNLRRAIHKLPHLEEALRYNIMTIHALLEYQPVTYYDPILQKDVFRFEPQRNAQNPLTITHLVIEEASMVDLDLWSKLYDALPSGVQIVFIGDINQLPPVFGPSIMNYALVQLPVIELTHVYRQALHSPVLANAHRILKGESLIEDKNESGSLTIVTGKKDVQTGAEKTAKVLGNIFQRLYEEGEYDPDQDMILSPWNKSALGTIDMNYRIAQFIGDKRQATVFEIIAGFNKIYLAEGDRIMYNKKDAIVTRIRMNGNYMGRMPQEPGRDLSRFGLRIIDPSRIDDFDLEPADAPLELSYSNFSVDELLNQKEDRVTQASHIVDIEYVEGGTDTLSGAGDFSPQIFSLGYCLTVHKAQGSEWRKVFIILHNSMAVSLYRELFYTAVTRARQDCIIFAKDFVIEKAIRNQRIKGNTLEDKIEYFNSGLLNDDTISVTK